MSSGPHGRAPATRRISIYRWRVDASAYFRAVTIFRVECSDVFLKDNQTHINQGGARTLTG